MMKHGLRGFSGAVFLSCVLPATAGAGEFYEHGDAIVLSPAELQAPVGKAGPVVGTDSAFVEGEISGFSVDSQDRTEVLSLYHCIYQASEGFESRMNWIGNIPACDEGTVSSAFHDDTLRRINYYRAMVGLNTDITFDTVKNAKCQKAALIMARNNGLSHDPILEHPTWSCLTVDGDEAAGASNLSRGTGLDYTGPRAVDGQIRDDGANNIVVGHRRWLLYPPAVEMGNGGIPWVSGYSAAASVWVIGDFGPYPPGVAWTSWPNPGYVPYDLVPARWSFSMQGADFDNATVTMTHDGAPVALTKIHPTVADPAVGVGDPSIVWEPVGIPGSAPVTDETYTVVISNIVGGISNTVAYSVTRMDPFTLNQDIVVSGPENPHAFTDNGYSFTSIGGADSYHLRIRKLVDTNWLEGAEDVPAPQIIDGTDPSYALRQTDVVQTGAKAFHMALPAFDDQMFEIDRSLVPSATSTLSFYYLRRWMSVANELLAQVSTDDGASWTTVWSVGGVCPLGQSCSSALWDTDWIPASQSLGAYAGEVIRLRFVLADNNYSFGGVDEFYGVFVDDITVNDTAQEIETTETNLPGSASSFTLNPDGLFDYIMDMYVELGCHVFDYGPATTVQAVPGLRITHVGAQAGQVVVGFDVTGGTYSVQHLFRSSDGANSWTEDTGAVYNPSQQEFTTPAATGMLYRVTGDL